MSSGVPAVTGEATVPDASPDGTLTFRWMKFEMFVQHAVVFVIAKFAYKETT